VFGRVALYTTPLARKVIGCAIEVHKQLGPGLLESTYDQCFARELSLSKIGFLREAALPVVYKGVRLDWVTASTISFKVNCSWSSRRSKNCCPSTRHRS